MNDLLRKHSSYVRFQGADVELGATSGPREPALQEFFRCVESIQDDIAAAQKLQDELSIMHQGMSKDIKRTKEMDKRWQDMQRCICDVSARARTIKSKLDGLDKANQAAKKVKGQEEGSANERTRTSITAGLRKKLRELMESFSVLQTGVRSSFRDAVRRRVRDVTGKDVPDDTVEIMIDEGNVDQLLQQQTDVGRDQVMAVFTEVQERNKAFKDLERSLVELHKLFVQMAVLVHEQGKQLDEIDEQMGRAVSYVEKGKQEIQIAVQHFNNARKKKMWMVFIAVIILLLVILIPVFSTKPWL